jgi:hypothetical protein
VLQDITLDVVDVHKLSLVKKHLIDRDAGQETAKNAHDDIRRDIVGDIRVCDPDINVSRSIRIFLQPHLAGQLCVFGVLFDRLRQNIPSRQGVTLVGIRE